MYHVLNINIIINIYFNFSLNFILKFYFNIYVHKKTFIYTSKVYM